jgi:hypothetical protein
VATVGALTLIVRNFGILKIWLFLPTLLDQYNIGPGDETEIAKAMSNSGNKNIRRLSRAKVQSNSLFILVLYFNDRFYFNQLFFSQYSFIPIDF